MTEKMTLDQLLDGLPHQAAGPLAGRPVGGLSYDSRKVKPGDVFVALKGQKQDGHDHAAAVAAAGAAAVIAERPLSLDVPVVVVPSTLAFLSEAADRFYRHPSRDMTVVGVTGTNGKTTITYMLEAIFRRAGFSAGVIGTINHRWSGVEENAANTTPLASDLQLILRRMKDAGVSHVAMEVSSHALDLHRADHVDFSTAVFTNLTRDHLDHHQTMENYFEAKAKLFDLAAAAPSSKTRCAIINRDDLWAEKFLSRLKIKALTYGVDRPAALMAKDLLLTAEGNVFTVTLDGAVYPFHLQSVGRHNVYNALAAIAAAVSLGLPMKDIQTGLASLAGVPGRLERVAGSSPKPFGVFVDYAHTDDALKNVLRTLRPLTQGRLITVFGCGGDRDRTKRPLMGQTAVTMSDHAIVTSDNPRTEDPERILADIEGGITSTGKTNYEKIIDRASAIEKAVRGAKAGDVVLIAGKGHETYQIFKDRTIHFDDRETARGVLETMA